MMMLLFLLVFYAGQYNSVRATLEGCRTSIRAEVVAEYNDSAAEDDCEIYRAPVNTAVPHHGAHILCSAYVHGITNPAHYARNQARQLQAEEAERGQHLEKQLTSIGSSQCERDYRNLAGQQFPKTAVF
jgi:hypothetical protein